MKIGDKTCSFPFYRNFFSFSHSYVFHCDCSFLCNKNEKRFSQVNFTFALSLTLAQYLLEAMEKFILLFLLVSTVSTIQIQCFCLFYLVGGCPNSGKLFSGALSSCGKMTYSQYRHILVLISHYISNKLNLRIQIETGGHSNLRCLRANICGCFPINSTKKLLTDGSMFLLSQD